jgi:hypothetical protein
MKRLLLFAALLARLVGGLSAQNPNHQYSLDAMTRSLFERLDKSSLHSGILLQQSAIFINPFRFDGTALNDSNQMDAGRFGKLFGQLRAASVGQPVLPDPGVYLDELRRRQEGADTVLLALLAMQFDYIKADAFDTGLLQWGADNKVSAVPGQSTSPYQVDTTFAFAALTEQVAGAQVVFRLPSQFIFNNLGWSLGNVQIDFGDGQGWREVRPDECITAKYVQSGQKPLRLQVQQNGRTWQAHSFLTIPEPSVAERYSATPDEIVALGGVNFSIFFDCEDKKLRKPLIVVEGFGGDMTDVKKMFELLNIAPTGMNMTLKDFLDDEGYDLIWVDWSDANARIQDNAAALQAALEYINARKRADGSSEPNIMIGASMGGLIGKYCLLHVHNIQGKDAEVERFFTYDSPLKGANFPVGIQLLVRDLLSLSGSTASDPNIQAALQLLDGYAATQMLRQKAIIDANGNLMLSSAGIDV